MLHSPLLPACLQVRCRLRLPTGAAADSSSHLPELQSGHDLAPQETDERGRAFLGDLSIAEGSGVCLTTVGASSFLHDSLTVLHKTLAQHLLLLLHVGHAASGALQCELVCEALGLYPSSAHELETDGDGWAVCWSCPVLFSDDAARCVVEAALRTKDVVDFDVATPNLVLPAPGLCLPQVCTH